MKLPGQYPFWGLMWRGTPKDGEERVYICYGIDGPLQFRRKKDADAHSRLVYGSDRVRKLFRVTHSKWSRPKAVKVAVEFTIRDGK